MATCKRCKQAKTIYKAHLCSQCYQISKNLLGNYKNNISKLYGQANPEMSGSEKENLIAQVQTLQEAAKENNLPLHKSIYQNDIDSIRFKLGLPKQNHTKSIKRLLAVCGVLLSILVVVSVVYIVTVSEKNQMHREIAALRTINEYLEAENAALRSGAEAGNQPYTSGNGMYISFKNINPSFQYTSSIPGKNSLSNNIPANDSYIVCPVCGFDITGFMIHFYLKPSL